LKFKDVWLWLLLMKEEKGLYLKHCEHAKR